jgi:hypothetical protein
MKSCFKGLGFSEISIDRKKHRTRNPHTGLHSVVIIHSLLLSKTKSTRSYENKPYLNNKTPKSSAGSNSSGSLIGTIVFDSLFAVFAVRLLQVVGWLAASTTAPHVD